MNMKAVQWLYKELPELVSQGVLSSESSENLHKHYGEVKNTDKRWFVIMLCGVLGVLLIGLGIISIIAHNWEQLSRTVRGVISILPLLLGQMFALSVLIKWPASHALKEASGTFLSLMVGASIALISQTYNIPGDTADFILIWMLLILPIVYLLQAAIPAAFFAVGIVSWAGYVTNSPMQSILFWPLLALIVPYFIWSLYQEKFAVRSTILAFVMAISLYFGAAFSLGKTFSGSWIIILSSLIGIFFYLGTADIKKISKHWQRPFAVLGGVGAFVMMLFLTYRYPWDSISSRYYYNVTDMSSWLAVPDHVVTFILIAAALLCFLRCVRGNDLMRTMFCALPLIALIGFVFYGVSEFFAIWLFNGYLLIVSVIRIMNGVKNDHLGVVNSGMFMLATLVVARFFDGEINFIIKGLVFILIGIGFLVTNVMILRRKGEKS